MKKFISFFCYFAMAIAAVSFVSCGDDDDDMNGPNNGQTPNSQKVQIYAAEIGKNALDVFDIKLNVYRNGKKQVVVLDKKMLTPYVRKETDFLDMSSMSIYCCTAVNGVEGVDSVIAEVAVKSNIEEIIASNDPNGGCTLSCSGEIVRVNKVANGDYVSLITPSHSSTFKWKDLLAELNGVVRCETYRADAQSLLTAKSK